MFFSKRKAQDPLANIPLTPGGLTVFEGSTLMAPESTLLASLAATLTYESKGDACEAAFLLGFDDVKTSTMFPNAQTFKAPEVLDGLVIPPSTFALILRLLYGEKELEAHQHDLLLLEMLGLHSPPLSLPLFPEWVENQLTPKSILRSLTNPLADERTAGAALKALMMHPSFQFAMLDYLPGVAQRITSAEDVRDRIDTASLKKPVKDAFREWSVHVQKVVSRAKALVANPPKELFFLAGLKNCIEAGGVWKVSDAAARGVVTGMHVFGMANGLGLRHHWVINTACKAFQGELSDIHRSVERFAYQLWQETTARENGFGPSLWIYWQGSIQGHGPRRLLKGTQATMASLDSLAPLLKEDSERRGETEEAALEQTNTERLGLYESSTGQYRHLHDHELKAYQALAI